MDRMKDEREQDLPHRDQKGIEEQAERSREDLDKVPEPGSDPLNEGP